MVSWMDGQPGNIISTTPSDLGPDYTVKLSTGGKVTKIYDLYPLCPGGARAYRTDGGHRRHLVLRPEQPGRLAHRARRTGDPGHRPAGCRHAPRGRGHAGLGPGDVMRDSRGALLLAGFAAALVLLLLALAARYSRRSERQRTAPAAVTRLAAATARRTGSSR